LKQLIAILTLLGFMLQTFSQVVTVARFYAEKDYIAKNLCENKDKPQMHCEGKCCLKKKLAKQGREQAPTRSNQKDEQVLNLYYAADHVAVVHFLPVRVLTKFFNFDDLNTIGIAHSVFHPPCA